jgi:hypothetical protein
VGRVQVVNLSVLAGDGVEEAAVVSVNIRVANPDPGSGVFLTHGSRIRNEKNRIRD